MSSPSPRRHRGQRLLDDLAGRALAGPDLGGQGQRGAHGASPPMRGTRKRWSSTAGAAASTSSRSRLGRGSSARSTLLKGDRVRRRLEVRQVQRRHVGRVVEHGPQLRGEELDLLVTQIQPGQACDVDDVLPAQPRRLAGVVGHGRGGSTPVTNSTGARLDLVLVPVQRGHVEAPLEHHLLDRPLGPGHQVLARHGVDDVVLHAGEDEHGAGDRLELRLHLGRGGEQRERRPQREAGVGRLDRALHRDVGPDAGCHLVAALDHRLDERHGVGVGRREQRVDDGDGGDLGMALGQPDAQHAAHGEAHDHDAVAAGGQLGVGRLGRLGPVLPPSSRACRRSGSRGPAATASRR